MQNPCIRKLSEMKFVLYDQQWAKTAEDFEVYRFWRGEVPEKKWQDKEIPGLRYDITIIHPKILGKEFSKTMGHCHKNNVPELIKILEGKAFYLFQKGGQKVIEDVYVVEAETGEFVLVPKEPFYHLTINPSPKNRLVMANWISYNDLKDYEFFEKMQGACYYYTTEGWIKNPNYAKIPKLRFAEPLKEMPKDFKG